MTICEDVAPGGNCESKKCPDNYSPDVGDKCICKCNERPSDSTNCKGLGRSWDRTTCECYSYCDAIPPCPEGQEYSIRSCTCNPTCEKTVCPANTEADPDNKCECKCTLPAQICNKKSHVWSTKICKCVKENK